MRKRFAWLAGMGMAAALTAAPAFSDLIVLDLNRGAQKTIAGLGTKIVICCLILGVSAIISAAMLRKR